MYKTYNKFFKHIIYFITNLDNNSIPVINTR